MRAVRPSRSTARTLQLCSAYVFERSQLNVGRKAPRPLGGGIRGAGGRGRHDIDGRGTGSAPVRGRRGGGGIGGGLLGVAPNPRLDLQGQRRWEIGDLGGSSLESWRQWLGAQWLGPHSGSAEPPTAARRALHGLGRHRGRAGAAKAGTSTMLLDGGRRGRRRPRLGLQGRARRRL